MPKALIVVLLLALAGCAGMNPYQAEPSPCDAGETTYGCQVKRYNDVRGP
jgi:hypothetical protein